MTHEAEPPILSAILQRLEPARRIAVLTGAGMSAESGIPTFRGTHDSLWARFEPEQLATPQAWQQDRRLVWGWYRWRTGLVAQAAPNDGHRALAGLQDRRPGLTVITQNVDDLHERAGSRNVIHLHGSLFAPRCGQCGRPHREPRFPAAVVGAPTLRVEPPACGHCGHPVRPGVVWFGESLPQAAWNLAAEALQRCDALLVVGTSGVVHPAAGLPERVRQRGRPVIEINPEPSGLSRLADIRWATTAAAGLPALLAGLGRHLPTPDSGPGLAA